MLGEPRLQVGDGGDGGVVRARSPLLPAARDFGIVAVGAIGCSDQASFARLSKSAESFRIVSRTGASRSRVRVSCVVW